MEKITTRIKGMHCASCSSRIEKVVGAMDGIVLVSVNLASENVELQWQAEHVSLEEIQERIAGLGFELIVEKPDVHLALVISGMHCASCSSRIEKVVGGLNGVDSCHVNLASGQARVSINPYVVSRRQIREAIEALGFKARDESGHTNVLVNQQQEIADRLHVMKRKLLPSFILALLVMLVSMGEMVGLIMPQPINPVSHPFTYAFLQFCLVVPVLWMGRNFYIIGFPSLFRGSPNMDSLIAVGTGAAFVYSSWNMVEIWLGINPVARAHDLYFESAAMLIALVSLGKFLELRSKARTSDAISQLMQLAPDKATLIKGESQEEILVDDIVTGDLLLNQTH